MFYPALKIIMAIAGFILFLGFCSKVLDRYRVSEVIQYRFFAMLRWTTIVILSAVIFFYVLGLMEIITA